LKNLARKWLSLRINWNRQRLWEAENGKHLATFLGHTNPVNSAVFSPDGRRVLTASEDKTARLWEAENGKLLATFQGHTDAVRSAVFSPDGRRVLTASGNLHFASEDNTARLGGWERHAADHFPRPHRRGCERGL
jgi:WD40 repeat protein